MLFSLIKLQDRNTLISLDIKKIPIGLSPFSRENTTMGKREREIWYASSDESDVNRIECTMQVNINLSRERAFWLSNEWSINIHFSIGHEKISFIIMQYNNTI